MASSPLLEVSRLRVVLDGRVLLEDVSLQLESGERVALIGASGTGKSTLLKAIAGLVPTATGELSLGGQRPEALGWPTYRRRCLYVHQTPVMRDDTVEANLRWPFELAAAGPFPDDLIRRRLAEVGLADIPWGQQARTLSIGEQQRVALIRALATEPEVLLLDEPTSALDRESTQAIEAALMADGALTMLLVTHDPDQAQRLTRRQIDVARFKP